MTTAEKTLPPNAHRLWSRKQVRDFVRQAKDRVGELGWAYLSPEMRQTLIDQKALQVVLENFREEGVPLASIQCLVDDMKLVAGLTNAEKE